MIVSSCNDGRFCVWNMELLNQPTIVHDLHTKNIQVNTTCIAVKQGETDGFLIGTENGQIHLLNVHSKQEKIEKSFLGHSAPISALSINSNQSDIPKSNQGLLLSSSFDWSVYLWNPQNSSEIITKFESAQDYVFDVKWNPVNTSLFASVDGEGYIDIWSLDNLEEPKIHFKTQNQVAINKVEWSNDGLQLLIGDALGNIQFYKMNQQMLYVSDEQQEIIDKNLHVNLQIEVDSDQDFF